MSPQFIISMTKIRKSRSWVLLCGCLMYLDKWWWLMPVLHYLIFKTTMMYVILIMGCFAMCPVPHPHDMYVWLDLWKGLNLIMIMCVSYLVLLCECQTCAVRNMFFQHYWYTVLASWGEGGVRRERSVLSLLREYLVWQLVWGHGGTTDDSWRQGRVIIMGASSGNYEPKKIKSQLFIEFSFIWFDDVKFVECRK